MPDKSRLNELIESYIGNRGEMLRAKAAMERTERDIKEVLLDGDMDEYLKINWTELNKRSK